MADKKSTKTTKPDKTKSDMTSDTKEGGATRAMDPATAAIIKPQIK